MFKIYHPAYLLALLLCVTPLFSYADESTASRYYENAVVLKDKGDLKAVIIELKNALQENPNFLAARILLGKTYILLEQGADAEKQLTDANKLGADLSVTLIPLAQAYLLQEKHQLIIDNIDPKGQSRTTQSELLAYRGHAYLALRDTTKATNAFAESERLNPDSDRAFTGQAIVLLHKGKLEAAAKSAEQATKLNPDSYEAWNAKASISHAQGKLNIATKEYERSLSLKPQHIDTRIARIGIYIDQKEYQKASADIAYLRTEFPMDPQSAYLLGVLHEKQGAFEESEKAIIQAANILDAYKDSYVEKTEKMLMLASLINYDLRRFEKAKYYLRKYIQQFPDRPSARKLMGSILIQQGKFNHAIATLKPALNYIPKDMNLLSMLGTAYMNSGQHNRANIILKDAVTLSKGNAEMRTKLAINHLKSGNQKLATQQLTTIFEENNRQVNAGIALAQAYIKTGDFNNALRIAEKLVLIEPASTPILNLLGSIQVRNGAHQRARATFNKALQLQPELVQTQLNLGKLDILENKPNQARQRYMQILKKNDDNIAAMYEMARLEDTLNNKKASIRLLEKIHAINKDSLEATLYLSDLYLRTGKPDKALEIAKEAEQTTPKNLKVLAANAKANLALGKPEIAQLIYRKMASQVGNNPEKLYNIASLQLNANLLDDGIYTLDKAVNTQIEYLPAQIKFIQALLQTGKANKAKEYATALRTKHPKMAFSYRLMGDVYLQQGSYKNAIKNYQQAMEKDPSTQHAILIYQAKNKAGNHTGAISFLQQWLQSHPKDQIAKMALAEGNLQLGNLKIAKTMYEKLLENNPNFPEILNNLANIYHQLNDKRALSTAEKAYKYAPEAVSINDTLGWILANQGQAERSLRYLRDAHFRDSNNPEIRYHLAFALDKLGRFDEAKKELNAALNNGQQFHDVTKARQLQKKLSRKK